MHCWLCSFATATLAAFACSKPNADGQASVSYGWYLRAAVDPQDTAVLGLPMRELDTAWTAGVLLSPAILPPEAAVDPLTKPTPDFGYDLEGDFNRDGTRDRALVGVYRSGTGAKGRFVLVVTRAGNRWQKAFSAGMTGPSDVTFLGRGAGDTLVWNDCVECDAPAVKIYWDGRTYVAKWQDE